MGSLDGSRVTLKLVEIGASEPVHAMEANIAQNRIADGISHTDVETAVSSPLKDAVLCDASAPDDVERCHSRNGLEQEGPVSSSEAASSGAPKAPVWIPACLRPGLSSTRPQPSTRARVAVVK